MNWRINKMSEDESSSNFFIFGNREIFPLGYPPNNVGATEEKKKGEFMMSNGIMSTKTPKAKKVDARFREQPFTWIPEDVSNFDSKINKYPTYDQVLIFYGELHFGAKWDAEKNIFVESDESIKWKNTGFLDKIKYMSKFSAMHGLTKTERMTGKGKSRFRYSDEEEEKLRDYTGFGEDKNRAYRNIVEAYHSSSLKKLEFVKYGEVKLSDKPMEDIFPAPKTPEERKKARATRAKYVKPETEMDEVSKRIFKTLTVAIKGDPKYPYMEEYRKKLKARNIENPDPRISGVYAVFLINNMVNEPWDLTIGMEGDSQEKKLDKMKEMVATYSHWASQYYTDEKFYETPWHDKYLDKEMKFAPHLWEELKDFPYREHKRGLPRKYIGATKREAQRKTASDKLTSFVENAPMGLWLVGKQPPKTILSRKIQAPKYSIQGQNIDDLQVREALKFLETGKKHKWIQEKYKGKNVIEILDQANADGSTTTIREPVMKLVPDEEDKVIHYNPTLKEYQKWGKPFTPTAPASMFFRLGILTGWRKTEGLTCPTREVSESFLEQNAGGIKMTESNPSGLWIDNDGNLNIAFLTRKTQKIGNLYFLAIIPPFSSETMDTQETIELVMILAGKGKWKSHDFFNYIPDKEEFIKEPNINWTPEIAPLSEEEKKLKSDLVVGKLGQFYDEKTRFENKEIYSFDLPTGTEVDDVEDPDMVDAFLNYPLRECYTILNGTTLTVKESHEIAKQVEEDAQHGKLKQFAMEDGWATICSVGCPKATLNTEAKGLFSRERMEQDKLRYESALGEEYWIEKPNHSIRHLFAQLWLSKSDWNFGVVADRGHWETLDVLKDHYGGMNKKKLAGFMIQVLGKKQVGTDKDNQQMQSSLGKVIEKSGFAEKSAQNLIDERVKDVAESVLLGEVKEEGDEE
jgi:hypothetical protein